MIKPPAVIEFKSSSPIRMDSLFQSIDFVRR